MNERASERLRNFESCPPTCIVALDTQVIEAMYAVHVCLPADVLRMSSGHIDYIAGRVHSPIVSNLGIDMCYCPDQQSVSPLP